jgi:hypothetical protein
MMSTSSLEQFSEFDNDCRVWCYAFVESLSPQQVVVVEKALDDFLSEWKSHGTVMKGCYQLFENRFAVILLEQDQDISGCSIDSSVAVFKTLKYNHGLDALERSRVFYRSPAGQILVSSRTNFSSLCGRGEIETTTSVFNMLPTSLLELRNQGGLEMPFKDSWHAQAFRLASASN